LITSYSFHPSNKLTGEVPASPPFRESLMGGSSLFLGIEPIFED